MVELLQFGNLASQKGVAHFVTTRTGGVSEGPFASLNMSLTVGDLAANVLDNRRRVAEQLKIEPRALTFASKQMHQASVWEVTQVGETPRQVDVLVTRKPGIAVAVLLADCVPVLLYDSKRRVVAAVHSGRRGMLAGAIPAAVNHLRDIVGVDPADLVVGIGPAIAAKNYTLAPVDVELIQKAFPYADDVLSPLKDGWATFDLWETARRQLLESGVKSESIEIMRRNTFDETEHFYSARRQKPFGCFASGIMLI